MDLTLIRPIVPDWPAPASVRAVSTTRQGGGSVGAWAGFNLGDHVDDDPAAVLANRDQLQQAVGEGVALQWLQQVHGIELVEAQDDGEVRCADASYSQRVGQACLVMTADCLPVLFCDRAGSRVAAAHAGWRGLLDGVLESTVARLGTDPGEILCWLGPAIGPDAFEVGDEVRRGFCAADAQAQTCFKPGAEAGKWLADLYGLARQRLQHCGVTAVYGGDRCTFSEAETFYSYRRDGVTGRMASLVWLAD